MEGLLTKDGVLYVPPYNNWRTYLIDEVHSRLPTAHPGCDKTKKLLQAQYYWPAQASHVATFLSNCQTCRRSHAFKDKKPGLLKPLPIPDRVWQHISMDFKSVPKDRQGYDNIFVVICCLSKRAFSLLCFKTVTAPDAAMLCYTHLWCI